MAKYRRADSYYGRTGEAKENQRRNLIPGGPWQKKSVENFRLICWWEIADIGSKRFIYEGFANKRDIKDVPKGELKSEEFINGWWGELELEDKIYLYWAIMDPLPPEEKVSILKHIHKCLEGKKLNNYV